MIRATSITLRFHIFDDWKCNYVEWGTHPHLTMKLSQLQLPSGLRRLVNDRCELHWQHRHCPRAPLIFFLSATESNIFSSIFYLSVSRFVSLNGNRIWLFISRWRMHRNWGWFCSILTDKWVKLFFFIQRDGVFWWQRQGSRVWQPLRTREVNWVAEPYIERKCSVPTENATALGLTLPLCQMASIWMRRCGRICVAHPKPILFFV